MIIFLLAFAVLLIIGVPISISIGASAVLGCLSLGYPLVVIGQKMVSGIDSFLLIAVPLFILAGNLMNAGKITEKIFDTAKELVGWIPGGLDHANVVASVIFAGMSGSAVADAGGLGTIEMEAMRKNGYDDDFASAVTASSSVIGPIFPPSIPLIIYGSVASVSVYKLFMGGVMPGLLMALLTILSGFVLGWFTPTEASSIAVIYSLIIALLVYKTLTWKSFLKRLKDSAISSANTLLIIGTSTLFTYVMAMEGISRQISGFILGLSSNPAIILLTINILLLILGMIMEPGAILTLILPVLLPISNGLGLNLVRFGVMIVLNLMIGQVTPPFGVCLFVISDVNKIKLESMYKSIVLFLIPLIVTLILVTYIPGIVTWLPNALLA